MRFSRISFVVGLLAAGLLASLPGIAEGIESVIPGDDCTEDCPADTDDGKCGSSCDDCTCCPRALSAVFLPCLEPGTPERIEAASQVIPTRTLPLFSTGVYHPPRA